MVTLQKKKRKIIKRKKESECWDYGMDGRVSVAGGEIKSGCFR